MALFKRSEAPVNLDNPANNPLVLRPAPQISSAVTTHIIMRDVLVALIPATVAAVAYFGLRALLVIATSIASCVGFEYLWCRLRKTPQTIGDLSAAVTGLLLAFNVPSTLPLYMVVIGAFVAIIMTKELFGGIGKNFANPAIVGRIFLAVAFPVAMTTFVGPQVALSPVDVVSSATPLAPTAQPLSYLELLLGMHMGVLGETSALALLLGMVFLLYRPVITWHIPVAYVGTVCVLSLLTGHDVIAEALSGGLLLGAIYMATDYSTCPATKRGKLVFGVGCGLITCLIRFFGNLNEGVAYSILFMNLLVPYIDQLTPNIPVGGEAIIAERRRAKRGGKAHE
ncbi:MAG: RnfABCDGE type electron transport complex subunit D [Atopobiaceae bacterium]|nr:RnfABCDGE type electron transport complex subunit D [Atopobiaceae bacterium]